MKTLICERIPDDDWGRKRIKNIETKRIYADVDGKWHTTSKDGEPDCPLNNPIEIKGYWYICLNCGRTVDCLNTDGECKDCVVKYRDENYWRLSEVKE